MRTRIMPYRRSKPKAGCGTTVLRDPHPRRRQFITFELAIKHVCAPSHYPHDNYISLI